MDGRNGDWNALISDSEEIKIACGVLMGCAAVARGLGTHGEGWRRAISSSLAMEIEVIIEKRTSVGGAWLEIPKPEEAFE